jgi:DNA-binding transcriptional ArsR family regulator
MTYTDSFTALADPTRRLVFEKLARTPSAVGQLAQDLPVSRPAVSQHLRVLSDAGLVVSTAQGTRRIYAIRKEGLAELRDWVNGFWDDVLQDFSNEIDRLKGPIQ